MKILKCNFILLAIVFAVLSSSAQKAESFSTFWKSYTNDTVFQKERIVFPLTISYFDIDEERDVIYSITADDWEYYNFIDEETKITTIKHKDITTVVRSGIENGIYVEYTFKTIDKKWYLVKIADSSN